MKNIVAHLTILTFFSYSTLLPTYAYADDAPSSDDAPIEQVTTLQLGDPAPFAGTLFSTAAAARLLTNLEFSQEACQLEIDRQLMLEGAQYQLKIDTITASRAALQFRYSEMEAIRTSQIDFLQESIKPRRWFESGEFWFGMGVVGGVLITVGAGYALGQVSPQ